jgi:group I intron endonuclease
MYKTKPGIYKITNLVTGYSYVGSSKNVSKRIKTHKYALRNGYKYNIRIREDLEKFGFDSFVFELIEYCSIDDCLNREQYWFEKLNPFYNVWPSVYNAKGRLYTENQLKKFSVKREIKDKLSFSNKLKEAWKQRRLRPDGIATLKMLDRTGKLHSEETKKIFSEKRKGKIVSDETKEKIRMARIGTKWDKEQKKWIRNEG